MGDNGRSYVLERLKSRKTTIDEFNFDRLQAPPLSMFLTPYDIAEIRGYATSVKLSSKPDERYQLIDNVLKRRGLIKFGAGTNRVVYRHPEFNDILFKIATDNIGMGDNPAEYRNQFILKPFVAKTFEISPCGTVALVERVKPILNREEYLSVADDVFELINTWLVGKYVLADIGSKFMFNIGIRRSFGVVLLDYPYVYELDGNKLYCSKPDQTSISGKCDGVIDYDDGYNFLVCTRCGARYHAKELAKAIENKIIKLDKEEVKMGIRISGGTNNVSKEIKSEEMGTAVEQLTGIRVAKVAPSRPKTHNTSRTIEKSVNGVSVGRHQDANDNVPMKEENEKLNREVEKTVEETVEKVTEEVVETVVEEKVEEKIEESKDVVSPVSFDPSIKKDKFEPDSSSPVVDIEKSIKDIKDNIDKITIDDIKINTIENIFKELSDVNIDKLSMFKLLINTAMKIYSGIESDEEAKEYLLCDDIVDLLSYGYELVNNVTITDEEVNVTSALGLSLDHDVEIDNRLTIFLEDSTVELPKPVIEEDNEVQEDNDEETRKLDPENDGIKYAGITWYRAEKTKANNLIVGIDDSSDIIVPIDDDGNYCVNDEGHIMVIDEIDDHYIGDISIVSTEWLNSILEENETINPTPEEIPNEIPKKKIINTTEEVEVKAAPVGALPQTSVDGEDVNNAMEAFLQGETDSEE